MKIYTDVSTKYASINTHVPLTYMCVCVFVYTITIMFHPTTFSVEPPNTKLHRNWLCSFGKETWKQTKPPYCAPILSLCTKNVYKKDRGICIGGI